jgi:hypothetical protein
MTIARIPYEFISQRVELSWTEIKFGLDHELVKPKAAIEKAAEHLSGTDAAPKELVELASLAESEPVADLVSHLTKIETPPSDERIKDKWLYLVLAWLFEHRVSLVDPLGMVETVYSDFDYPKEIASFVRYMPMDGPDLGNREQNEARLFDRWRAYLNRAGNRFGRTERGQLMRLSYLMFSSRYLFE